MITLDPRILEPPELELGAAEALLAQAPALRGYTTDVIELIERLAPKVRQALAGEIRSLPEPEPDALYEVGAVDSSHNALRTVGLSTLYVVAFRTSQVHSDDHRVAQVQLDPGAETDAIAKLIRGHLEAELLSDSSVGDRLLILDNSFTSVAESAARAMLAAERADPLSLEREVLDTYVPLHLFPDGSLPRMLANAHVIALPKVGRANTLLRNLVRQVGAEAGDDVRQQPLVGLHDRLLLTHVLAPGEYLSPRALLGRSADRFFHNIDFPGRGELMVRFGLGQDAESHYGIDVVYFRPRPIEGGPPSGVLRVECQRAVANKPERLVRVLLSVEANLDGEAPEPLPQLLADQLARSAVSHIPGALAEAAMCDLISDPYIAGDPNRLSIAYSIFKEARS